MKNNMVHYTYMSFRRKPESMDPDLRRDDAFRALTKLILLFFLSLSSFVYGQTNLDMQAREIADQLRCPVCRGVPVAESPSELAQSMMQVIREKLAAGENREQILDYFVDRYGDWILLKPKAEGFNLAIWIMPLVVFLGGAGILTFSVIKWTHHKNQA